MHMSMRKVVLVSLLVAKISLAADFKDVEGRFTKWAAASKSDVSESFLVDGAQKSRLSTEQLKAAAGHVKWLGEYSQRLESCLASDAGTKAFDDLLKKCVAPGMIAESVLAAGGPETQWELSTNPSKMAACRAGLSAFLSVKVHLFKDEPQKFDQDVKARDHIDGLFALFNAKKEVAYPSDSIKADAEIDAMVTGMLDSQKKVSEGNLQNVCVVPAPAAAIDSGRTSQLGAGGAAAAAQTHAGAYNPGATPPAKTAATAKPAASYNPGKPAAPYNPGRPAEKTYEKAPSYDYKPQEYSQSYPVQNYPYMPAIGGYGKKAAAIPPPAAPAVVASPAAATPIVRNGLPPVSVGVGVSNRKVYPPMMYPPPMPVPPPPPPPPAPVVLAPKPTPRPVPKPRVSVTQSVTPVPIMGPMPMCRAGQPCQQQTACTTGTCPTTLNNGQAGTATGTTTNVNNTNPFYNSGTSVWNGTGTAQKTINVTR